jgi:hypothetical protein
MITARSSVPAHRLGFWLCGALLLTSSGTAKAATAMQAGSSLRSVEVAAPTCRDETFPMVSFLDSLRVELAGRGLACCTLVDPEGAANQAASLRVSVEFSPCAPEATTVRIGVAEPPEAQVEREVSLADVAQPARPRALALAAAELIRSLGQMPAKEMPKPAPVVLEQPPPSVVPTAPPMASRLSLAGEGQIRVLPTRNTTLWGGRLRLTLPWRRLYTQLDLGGDTASAKTELGTVSLHSVSMGLGMGPRFAGRALIFDVGPRFELGRAWIRGQTSAADVGVGSGGDVSATLGLRASLETPAETRLRPGIALEGGGVLRGIRGESEGRTVVGITGYYLIGTVALSFSP